MSAPTVTSATFINQVGATLTLGGTTFHVIEGGYDLESMSDDMTGNTGGGFKQKVGTVVGASGTMTLGWKGSGDAPVLAVGSTYALVSDVPTPGPYLSCPAFIDNYHVNAPTIKEGVKVVVKWSSNGTVVTARGS